MAIKRAPENKAFAAAPQAVAPAAPGYLMGGHGRLVCRCGAVLATCGHVGHQHLIYDTRPHCDACVGVG